MILKHFRNLAMALCLLAPGAHAASRTPAPDAALLIAYDAFNAGDPMKLARVAPLLKGNVLEPYVDYWALSLRLEDAGNAEVRAFLETYSGTYVAELLRAEWVKVLGKRADWANFEKQRAALPSEDLEIRCYGWLAHMARGERLALRAVKAVWREPGELPDGCNTLVDELAARDAITPRDVWQRVRLLFENGQITAAKRTLGYLPKGQSPDERRLAQAATRPQRLLARAPLVAKRRADREVLVLPAAFLYQ